MRNRLPVRITVIVFATIAGSIWLSSVGPINVVRISTPLEEVAPFWYMLSAFPIIGMLIADLIDLYRIRGVAFPTVELACQILLIVFISTFRLVLRLPISGHSLLTSFLITRRLLIGQTIGKMAHFEMAVVVALLGMLTYIKIVWWDDPITLLVGCFLGFLFACVGQAISKNVKASSEIN